MRALLGRYEQAQKAWYTHVLKSGPPLDPSLSRRLADDEGGLRWGTKLRCLGARPWAEVEAERAREKAALAEEEARKGGG